ncbi:hypothetical protein RHMOL_Rhmol10G0172600 [Rhododendron molle]|uniref:Uncharacterized protein n=1 Tax=Rhododendron molle TaxID=49168 RepID=A0ACC0M386_RHOML|nr:hypothetical protein RHMOL_Rhmol10G0172600 [Rhododendron molle]
MATVSKCWSLPTISSSPSDLRRANRLQITMFVAPASFATTMVFCIGAFSNGRMRRDKKMVKVREEEMKHRLFPRAMCNSQRIYCCFGLKMEARANSNLAKTSLVAGFATGWSKTQSLYIRQPANCHSSPLGALLTSKTQDISSKPFTGDEEIGVLLLNLGGPETLDDVQPFLFNLFADPAEELRKALCTKNVPAKVYVGMRYWHPFTEEAIEQIKRDGITKLVVLPLYPQFSISTSGSSLRLLESIFREDEYLVNMQHTVIPSWYQREGYIKAMADLIAKELGSFDCPDKVMIFFSAHGVPLAYVEEAGDPYKAEMEECVDLIMEELEKRRITNAYTLAYQVMMPPLE